MDLSFSKTGVAILIIQDLLSTHGVYRPDISDLRTHRRPLPFMCLGKDGTHVNDEELGMGTWRICILITTRINAANNVC